MVFDTCGGMQYDVLANLFLNIPVIDFRRTPHGTFRKCLNAIVSIVVAQEIVFR